MIIIMLFAKLEIIQKLQVSVYVTQLTSLLEFNFHMLVNKEPMWVDVTWEHNMVKNKQQLHNCNCFKMNISLAFQANADNWLIISLFKPTKGKCYLLEDKEEVIMWICYLKQDKPIKLLDLEVQPVDICTIFIFIILIDDDNDKYKIFEYYLKNQIEVLN